VKQRNAQLWDKERLKNKKRIIFFILQKYNMSQCSAYAIFEKPRRAGNVKGKQLQYKKVSAENKSVPFAVNWAQYPLKQSLEFAPCDFFGSKIMPHHLQTGKGSF
jgi:hypothetical protein